MDQFEEVFTGPAAAVSDHFLDALSVAVEDPASPLRLIVTLRADYYDRPLEHPVFARILKETAVDVTPLAPDELERAIVEPARRVGVEFESGLVPKIAAETVRQPSPLPMLQYMLGELFDRRTGNRMTAADYEGLGGLSGALAARAEAVFTSGTARQKAAARRSFGRMTDPSATDLRRRAKVSDLGDDPAVSWVLEEFGRARLLSFDRDPASREPTVEVAHEALLREWPRLVGWLAEDRELLLSADATAMAADAWMEAGRQPGDLYRGARLERANELAVSAPERLRAVDHEFIEASNAAAEAARVLEESRVTRLRRLVVGVAAALVVALVAGAIALVQQNRANDEAQRAELAAEEARTQASIAESQAQIADQQTQVALDAVAESELQTLIARSAALTRDEPDIALLLALEAARRQPGPASNQAVLNALGSTTQNLVASYPPLVDLNDDCPDPIFVSGETEFGVADGQMLSRDLTTGEVSAHGDAPYPCAQWFGDAGTGRWFSMSLPPWIPPIEQRFGDFGDGWNATRTLDAFTFPVIQGFTALGNAVFLTAEDGPEVVIPGILTIVDGDSGDVIRVIEGHDDWYDPAVSGDGRYIAFPLVYFDPDGVSVSGALKPEGTGALLVVDGETGDEVFRIEREAWPRVAAFDDAAGELVVTFDDGSLLTIDLESQQVVSEIQSGVTSEIYAIGVRPDGLVVVVAAGKAELIDRRLGPLGVSLALRGTVRESVLPDGRLATWTNKPSVDVYDFDPSNALIDQEWDLDDPLTEYAFNDGKAGGVDRSTGDVRVVDLATGERSSVTLRMPDGSPFGPIKAYPEADGVSAINTDGLYGRFENGVAVETFQLDGNPGGGTRLGDIWSHIVERPDGSFAVDVLDLTPGAVRLVQSVPTPGPASMVHPTLSGGVNLAIPGGPLQMFDASGALVGEFEVPGQLNNVNVFDPTERWIAAALNDGGLILIDTVEGDVEVLPDTEFVPNLGFARDGELLAVTFADGRVRLWDVERGDWAGLIWDGEGATFGSPSWYDPETESMWIFASGKLLQVPLDPERWIEKACEVVGDGFTQEEWDRYVPGDEPLTSACD